MKIFDKWKALKKKKEKPEISSKMTEDNERKPKKSLFKRFYTSVFLKHEEKQIIKQISNENHHLQQENEDLILFYLLEMKKMKKSEEANKILKIHEEKFTENIVKELNNMCINIKEIAGLCLQGIPSSCQIIRPICWKLVLNYLPAEKNRWKQVIELKRIQYETYLEKSFFSGKRKNSFSMQFSVNLEDKRVSPEKDLHFMSCSSHEHPLSKEKTSNWNTFFNDQKLWDEIEKDVSRTKNNHPFFAEVNMNNEFFHYPHLSGKMRESTIDFENHYIAINRLLFVYAKQNPDIGYVQGMNEIIATLYYCFYNDQNLYFRKNSEVDTYFCFEKIMECVKENFELSKDKKLVEMEHKTKIFNEYLKKFDLKLWEHLKKNNIAPEFYFNKWLILMLTQEFKLEDVLSLWDPLISSQSMIKYIIYLCLGILISMRDQLIVSDFAGIMDLLQNTSKLEIKIILTISHNVFKEIQVEENK